MMKFIFLFLMSLTAVASPREEATHLLNRFQRYENMNQRLELFSRQFLGLPYGDGGPLGEGEFGRYDQDPLYRFDTFDCTTFVETILSLALSEDTFSFEQTMDEIRYEDGDVDYLKRNHFPSLQWIPNNLKNGMLLEVNHLILPDSERKMAEAVINLPGWLRNIKLEEIKVPYATNSERTLLLEELRSYSTEFTPKLAQLDYLPIPTLVQSARLLRKIPNGAIINFVRPNWDLTHLAGTHMNVSHQGFIFQKPSGTFLRHASSSGEKKVIEVPLQEYLSQFQDHPTLKGIHLMVINEGIR